MLMNAKPFYELVKESYHRWDEHKAMRLGAALAYYTVFSLAPLLVICLGVVGLIFGADAARTQVAHEIGNTAGEPVASAVGGMLKETRDQSANIWATVVGIVVLLFGASGVFGQLQDALNTVWDVAPKPDRGWLAIVKDRFLSFTMVLGTCFLLLVSLVVSSALAALATLWTPQALPGGTYLWQGLNNAVSLGVITLLFAAIYKVLPDAKIAWRDVWTGALVTALLFTIGKFLLGIYLGHSGVTSGYGAAGSLVLILLWVYYSSLILLFGAEFTRVYAEHHGRGGATVCQRGTGERYEGGDQTNTGAVVKCILPQDGPGA